MYNRSISLKLLLLLEVTSYINIMVSYEDIIGLYGVVNFMRNLCDAALMSCQVAALPFQAYANYGTWSIDFDEIFLTKLFYPTVA